MTTPPTVLLLGATGRTGRLALRELRARGLRVRALVRSAGRLPADLAADPGVEVVEAEVAAIPDEALRRHLGGCAAVVSCLGHAISLAGLFGPPRDLVTRTTARLCRALRALAPPDPVRLVLMSSVSVHRGGGLDARRGALERAFLLALRGLLPPARDNQAAADLLLREVGPDDPAVQWSVVRPDTLLPGDASPYEVHEGLVNGVFSPGHTRMANVAHFMGELVTSPAAWAAWRSRLPVIVDGPATAPGPPAPR